METQKVIGGHPPSLERRSIIGLRRSERGHPYRARLRSDSSTTNRVELVAARLSVAIARVLEQYAEITIFDLAKDKRSRAFPRGR